MSLRISVELKQDLEYEAKHRLTNLNALINRTLTKFVRFDRMAEHIGSVVLSNYLFSHFMRSLSEEELAEFGEDLGPAIVKPTFTFYSMKPDLNSLITHYFEPMGLFSGWFELSHLVEDSKHKLVLQHSHGHKWSIFLKHYVTGMTKSVLGVEPRIESEDGSVIIHLD